MNNGIVATVVMTLWLLTAFSGGLLFWKTSTVDIATAYYEGSAFDRIVLFILMAAGSCVLVFRRATFLTILRANVWLLVMLGYMAISIAWADFPFIAFKRLVKVTGLIIVFFACLSDNDPVRSLVRVITWACGIVIIVSLVSTLFFPGIGIDDFGDQGLCWKGMTNHKNQLGMWCATGIVLFLWHFSRTTKSGARTGLLALIGIALVTLVYSHCTTGALFGVVCIGVLYGVPFARKRGAAGWGALITIPAAIFLIASLVSELAFHASFSKSLLEVMGKDPTLTGRSEIWKLLVDNNIAHWIAGYGYGTFWLTPAAEQIRYALDWDIYSAHNGYIDLFVQLGAIGCIIMLVVIINALLGIRDLHQCDRRAALLWLAFLCGLFVTNFSETSFGLMTHEFWFLSALTCIRIPRSLIAVRLDCPSTGAEA